MKIKFVMSCCVLMMALPLNAFALQGENIAFQRVQQGGQEKVASPVFIGGDVNVSLGGFDVEENPIGSGNRFEETNDNQCTQGQSLAVMALSERLSDPNEDGTGEVSGSVVLLGTAKAITPVGFGAFAPNHCVSIGLNGRCDFDPQERVSVRSDAVAVGVVNAGYATSPGLAAAPNNLNQFATMDVFVHLLASGDCEFLDFRQDSGMRSVEDRDLGEEARLCDIVVDDDFSQSVVVGDTNLRTFHAGDGVFMTQGTLAASTEKSFDNFVVPFSSIEATCGVNRLLTARQRVPICLLYTSPSPRD